MFVFFKEKKTPFNQSDCGENTFENRYNFATKSGLRPRLTHQRIAHDGLFSKMKTKSWLGGKLNFKFSKSLGFFKTYTEFPFEVN